MSNNAKIPYYFDSIKIIRDLVHGYVNLSEFELKLIGTPQFQRLKDIRQLTCQQVYPSAKHTRFEHSLGVLELTKQAIKHLNRNGIIGKETPTHSPPIISFELQLNALIAALLHDIGHCPFSHLGEVEFCEKEVKEYLLETMREHENYISVDLITHIEKSGKGQAGAIHEMISCIVILIKYSDILTEDVAGKYATDFDLILRCILGIEYYEGDLQNYKENKLKNAIIRLINSKVFDMDKLDYIMKDSLFTGISIPPIDTQRLFRNMFFDENYHIVFTSKAVPVLQNIIDARDELYMYVYNHHAAVFSDFMNSFIMRRLAHNAYDFIHMLKPSMPEQEVNELIEGSPIFNLGLVPKPYLFSIDAIVYYQRTDSDWLSLLNILHTHSKDIDDKFFYLKGQIRPIADSIGISLKEWLAFPEDKKEQKLKIMSEKICQSIELIHRYKTRAFLKPWWKTVYEFNNFMKHNFIDETQRRIIGKWFCSGGENGLDALEFRSQVAKHVIYIASELYLSGKSNLLYRLEEGDFYIIERSNRFFEIDAIEKLSIMLKAKTGTPTEEYGDVLFGGFYCNSLTNIIPQKNYSSIYNKESFYIFSKPVNDISQKTSVDRHNRVIESIFVFVVQQFIINHEQEFIIMFQNAHEDAKRENELRSQRDMFEKFRKTLQN